MSEHGRTWILEDVHKTYHLGAVECPVLKGISLTLAPGQTLAVTGPSGSGKSTLLNIAGGLDAPTAGRVLAGGTDLRTLPERARAALRATAIGFVFQDHHLLPQLTVLENVLLPTLPLPPPRAAGADVRAHALLERLDIAHRALAFPATLSGGERQRAAIARAMINDPELLLCDEPTGNLDLETARTVIRTFCALARERQATVLMATHNLEHAARFQQRMILNNGRLEPAP